MLPSAGRSVSTTVSVALRNAGSVHVVEPASLADEVRAHAELALAAYDEQ